MDEFTVNLPNGRILECAEAGDPNGHPVFVFHGTPGSRLMFKAHVENASELGLRLISYNRPGYGGSTRSEGRVMSDIAYDVNSIAENMGLEKFAVWGHSGGGAPALSCASLLPERVVAVASISGLAPYGSEGIDFLGGMGGFNLEDFKLMLEDKERWIEKNVQDAELLKGADREAQMKMLSSLLSDVDRQALSEELSNFLHLQSLEAFERGVYGVIDDNIASFEPWGFDITSISIPVQIWHGGHDQFVPFTHGQWLAKQIPTAEPHLEPGEGHLTIFVNRMDDIHRWLLGKFG